MPHSMRSFEPYLQIWEPNEVARQALKTVTDQLLSSKKSAFLFVNNRLEGFAPGTIEAVIQP
jgi:hypothetical protein